MKKSIVTEIVNFEISPDLQEIEFIEIVNFLEESFHMRQSGYIDSELLKGKENNWTIIMHWKSIDEVKQASRLMMKDASTASFRSVIIPTSVKMSYLEQVDTWKIE